MLCGHEATLPAAVIAETVIAALDPVVIVKPAHGKWCAPVGTTIGECVYLALGVPPEDQFLTDTSNSQRCLIAQVLGTKDRVPIIF
jgi:hypothetical protein